MGELGAVGSGGYRGVSVVEKGSTRKANGQGAVFRTKPVVVVRIRREGVCRYESRDIKNLLPGEAARRVSWSLF